MERAEATLGVLALNLLVVKPPSTYTTAATSPMVARILTITSG